MDEVNFEKRGKLEDHQTCPICQACICDGHTHAKIQTIFAAILLTLLLAAPAWAADYTFEILEYPGATHTQAQAINDLDQVTGTHAFFDMPSDSIPEQGFLWRAGQFQDVSVLGSAQTIALSNNNLGDIAGTAMVNTIPISFILERNKPNGNLKKATIKEVVLPLRGAVAGLNDERLFVGSIEPGQIDEIGNREVGFLLDDGDLTVIDPEAPCVEASKAQGLNSDGVIVGWIFCSNPFGFMGFASYDAGDTFILFDYPGTLHMTFAKSVNEYNEIVGNYANSSGTHGFVFSNGFTSIDVPGATFTVATGINRRGKITGYFGDPSGKVLSFVATPDRRRAKH